MTTTTKMTSRRRAKPRAAATGRAAYSTAEVAALTGLCRDSVYGAIRAGKLVARKLGKRTLITDADLHRFLDGLPTLPTQGEAA
jgi:excisionase family DNA binding protein